MKTFTETQNARKPWLIILITIPWIIFLTYFIWAVNSQIINGIPVGASPISNSMLIATGIFIDLVFSFFLIISIILKLQINITSTELSFSFYPFLKNKTIPISEIKNAWVANYDAIKEYGGWGYRTLYKRKAYTIFGTTGIHLITQSGKHVMIGTHNTEKASQFLKEIGLGYPPKK